ncbi:class I adenylate-forming enzyme family protein [Cryptobacterium curtum]|uniref:class I adenylate-forming enzyme family protein n=1 Tax=Cryptobacterium curtum TaxID=84163 RepID=UPI0028D1D5A0|nr:class I adenylate-forming enzyme family protein [Cryptobacterium curtum]
MVSELKSLRLLREVEASIPEGSLMRLLRKGYQDYPGKNCLVWPDQNLTYAEAYKRAYTFAIYLSYVLKVKRGDVVLVSLMNVIDFPLIVAGIQCLGARLALMSAAAASIDYKHIVELLHPKVAVAARTEDCHGLLTADPEIHIIGWNCTGDKIDPYVNIIRRPIFLDRWDLPFVDEQEFQVILFSSGSTGQPKAIVNQERAFLDNAISLAASLEVTFDDTVYVPVPFSHVYGYLGMHVALSCGATLVSLARYTPELSLAQQTGAQISVYLGVTTMYMREMRINSDGSAGSVALRVGLVAGASIPATSFIDYEERFGCRLIQSWGMTETAATLTCANLNESQAIRSRSVGSPIVGVDVSADANTGELICKADHLMLGYLVDGRIVPPRLDELGWYRTGDIGVFDSVGRLYITGRIKDMVIRGGINIFPSEIENIYQDHPNVIECYMVGYPDPELGERTCLCVVLKHPAIDSAYDLREYARDRIEKCKYPDTVLKMDDMPRLSNGKIDRRQLKKQISDILDPAHRDRW